jgi:hypothetical protein
MRAGMSGWCQERTSTAVQLFPRGAGRRARIPLRAMRASGRRALSSSRTASKIRARVGCARRGPPPGSSTGGCEGCLPPGNAPSPAVPPAPWRHGIVGPWRSAGHGTSRQNRTRHRRRVGWPQCGAWTAAGRQVWAWGDTICGLGRFVNKTCRYLSEVNAAVAECSE